MTFRPRGLHQQSNAEGGEERGYIDTGADQGLRQTQVPGITGQIRSTKEDEEGN